jgi:hypothetical protein
VDWFISYQHSLRPDEAGVKFVCDQTEAAAEKLRLESRGYVVSRIAQRLQAWARRLDPAPIGQSSIAPPSPSRPSRHRPSLRAD